MLFHWHAFPKPRARAQTHTQACTHTHLGNRAWLASQVSEQPDPLYCLSCSPTASRAHTHTLTDWLDESETESETDDWISTWI